jgi:hypothetical protein
MDNDRVTRLDWRDTKESQRQFIGMLLTDVLAGSAVIDQQKREIKDFIGSVSGILRQLVIEEARHLVIEAPGGLMWDVHVSRKLVNIYAAEPALHGEWGWLFQSHAPDNLALRDVALVHAGLKVLLFGLLETFPEMEQALGHFVAAAFSVRAVKPNPLGPLSAGDDCG